MNTINILDENTIDKIAAGEVVERPLNVVKELIENSIDSGADSLTVEIKDGGTSFIRVTDNGCGIAKSEVRKAFMRHATSKIIDFNDLMKITSLGFRGEALSSISAVSNVELISKETSSLTGIRYIIEGSKEISLEEIGAPDGSTIIVRDLFYNVPARRKFLKSNSSEGNNVYELIQHLSLSHPEISFKFIRDNKTTFASFGNGNVLDVAYSIYGREIKDSLIPFSLEMDKIKIEGYLAKPENNRSSRTQEHIFINGRYVRCKAIMSAVEEGYKNFLMQHRFPFFILYLNLEPDTVDINVHPQKMEVKLSDASFLYSLLCEKVKESLSNINLIQEVRLNKIEEEPVKIDAPEPFETIRKKQLAINLDYLNIDANDLPDEKANENTSIFVSQSQNTSSVENTEFEETIAVKDAIQLSIFDKDNQNAVVNPEEYKILGQIFKTYWIIAYTDKIYLLDQHAAHEKVNYERLLKAYKDKSGIPTQILNPPMVLSLSAKEEDIVNEYLEYFNKLGFDIEDFGLGSIVIRSVPTDLYGLSENDFFREIIDELIENPLRGNSEVILNKLASMSCKASVKGNTFMNEKEVRALLDEMMLLDNPYNCPHGRPTLISMTKNDIDKKFKRIIN